MSLSGKTCLCNLPVRAFSFLCVSTENMYFVPHTTFFVLEVALSIYRPAIALDACINRKRNVLVPALDDIELDADDK